MKLLLLLPLLLLVGCAPESELDKIENSIPKGQGYWLEQESETFQTWDKVAFVFGYIDDYEMCKVMIEGIVERYPDLDLRCVPNAE